MDGTQIENPLKLAVALMFKRSGMSASKFCVWIRHNAGFKVQPSTLMKWYRDSHLDAQDLSDRKEEALRILVWAQDVINGTPTESTKDPASIIEPRYGYDTLKKKAKQERAALVTLADKPKFFF
jgi:hypothetical protein